MPATPNCARPSSTWRRQRQVSLRTRLVQLLQLQRIDLDIPSQCCALFAQRREPCARAALCSCARWSASISNCARDTPANRCNAIGTGSNRRTYDAAAVNCCSARSRAVRKKSSAASIVRASAVSSAWWVNGGMRAALALRQLRIGERGVVVSRQRRKQRMRREACLHQHPAWQCRLRPARPATCINVAEQPLRRTKVVRRQLPIRIQHDDQRDALKVVALRDHLRADEHIDIARMHRVERLLRPRDAAASSRDRSAQSSRPAAMLAAFPRCAACPDPRRSSA